MCDINLKPVIWARYRLSETDKEEIMANIFVNIIIIFIFLITGCASKLPHSRLDIKMLNGRWVSFSKLDTTILQSMDKAGVTGLSCAIINDSVIVYRRAFGFRNKTTGVLNNQETIFSAASFSKTVFAYLVMLLVEDGIVDLDKPLQEYLDKNLYEYPNYEDLNGDRRTGLITARMVLSHSTGFPNWRFLTNDGKLKIMFEPGNSWLHSSRNDSPSFARYP